MAARNAGISVCLSMVFIFGGCKPFECASPEQSDNVTVITQSCQLIELLNTQTWGMNSSDNLTVSGDIQISGSVIISSYCLNHPFPQSGEAVTSPVTFDDEYGGQGIFIVEKRPARKQYDGAQTLTLKDIKLRFRKVVMDGHPAYGSVPKIVLIPSADQPCGQGQQRCSSDQVCYDSEYPDPPQFGHIYYWTSYCLSCENFSQEECACRDAEGIFLDNDTYCGYSCSADYCEDGKCRGGVCMPAN